MNTDPIGPLDQEAMEAAQRRWDGLIKPSRGLGSLESFVVHLAGITSQEVPCLNRRRVLIMVAEHGVAEEGVSAYPEGMTRSIVEAFLHGQSGTSVLGRETATEVYLIDVGLKENCHRDCHAAGTTVPGYQLGKAAAQWISLKIAAGTKNFLKGRAMKREEVLLALQTGANLVRQAAEEGVQALALGEIGIGNTTSCSAITAALLQLPPEEVVGHGSGVSDNAMERKRRVVAQALCRHDPPTGDAVEVLSMVGGLEIAALTGAILEAARLRLPAILDGFVTCTAALCAFFLDPGIRDYLLLSHWSKERGQQKIVDFLQLKPLLAFDLQYGEGVGAVLALHQAYLATCVLRDMGKWPKKRNNDPSPRIL
ncbi:nicotinate-nucleotide--dimethylbenzimidazole phosphoribosyltransferase [Heliobacterium mobile]|uniref:nicotinate-nucleotide--dimethylbenzimidazole phosphoribosyltransferase n=1 Tax=Heliobacterium mobile TaxID=28064 RepID=UPI001478AC3F|nr:nicotinate-nucleotide--dimethylbenzimidazole phosphoribosyltransferase [Heliobacterium mobile]